MSTADAFLRFHKEHAARLTEKIREVNREIASEQQPLLADLFADFADLNEGGKLLRGVFVNLGCALAGGEDVEKSDALAIAFELFQTAVLIHDDIIDHASLRRGKPTVHIRYAGRLAERGIADTIGDTPSSAAICVGDAGLYLANRMIASSYDRDPRLGGLMTYFNDVVIDTIRGELMDVILPCESRDPSLTKAEADLLVAKSVEEIYHLKTARYSMIGPLHLGALYGGADGEMLARLDRFAAYAGTAFQIKDDILGIYAEQDVMGQDAGGDIAEGKLTILYSHMHQGDPALYEELMSVYGKEPVTPEALAKVQELFRKGGALAYAEEKMAECFAASREALAALSLPREKEELLAGLLVYLESRIK